QAPMGALGSGLTGMPLVLVTKIPGATPDAVAAAGHVTHTTWAAARWVADTKTKSRASKTMLVTARHVWETLRPMNMAELLSLHIYTESEGLVFLFYNNKSRTFLFLARDLFWFTLQIMTRTF